MSFVRCPQRHVAMHKFPGVSGIDDLDFSADCSLVRGPLPTDLSAVSQSLHLHTPASGMHARPVHLRWWLTPHTRHSVERPSPFSNPHPLQTQPAFPSNPLPVSASLLQNGQTHEPALGRPGTQVRWKGASHSLHCIVTRSRSCVLQALHKGASKPTFLFLRCRGLTTGPAPSSVSSSSSSGGNTWSRTQVGHRHLIVSGNRGNLMHWKCIPSPHASHSSMDDTLSA